MSTDDPLPRLANALHEVSDRIQQISAELRTLQPAVPRAAPSVPDPVRPTPPPPTWPGVHTGPVPNGPMPAGPVQPTGPVPTGPMPQVPAWPGLTPPPPAGPSLWERASGDGAGSRILAWAGGIVTLAGVVLLLVLAVQHGYLGPLPRVLLGAALGLTLAGIGVRLHAGEHTRTGAFALAATGFAVLYLDVVAATAQFEFLPPAGGLAAGLAVAGLGLLLATRWHAQGLAVFVVLGAACAAPLLTGGFEPLLVGFLLVLQIAATPAQLTRRWGRLGLAAGVPPVLAAVATIALTEPAGAPVVAFLALLTSAVQVIAATGAALRGQRHGPAIGLLLVAPAPAMFAAGLLPQAGAVALPGTVGALLVLVWALPPLTGLAVPPRFAMAAGAAGSVALLQATVTALDGPALAFALLAEALLLALVAQAMRYRAALAAAVLFTVAGLAAATASALPATFTALPPAGRLPLGTVAAAGLTGLLLTAAVLASCWVATRLDALTGDGVRAGWFAGGLVALYGATCAVLSVGLAFSPDRAGFLLGHVLVTVSWTVGALVLLLRGIESVPPRVAGLTLVGAALAKLALFDLSALDGLARVAAFLVAGLVLLGAGTRYAKLVSARTPYSPEA